MQVIKRHYKLFVIDAMVERDAFEAKVNAYLDALTEKYPNSRVTLTQSEAVLEGDQWELSVGVFCEVFKD